MFGKVTSKEVAESIKSAYGLDIDKRKIELKSDIKAHGTYECVIKLYSGIIAKPVLVVTD